MPKNIHQSWPFMRPTEAVASGSKLAGEERHPPLTIYLYLYLSHPFLHSKKGYGVEEKVQREKDRWARLEMSNIRPVDWIWPMLPWMLRSLRTALTAGLNGLLVAIMVFCPCTRWSVIIGKILKMVPAVEKLPLWNALKNFLVCFWTVLPTHHPLLFSPLKSPQWLCL